MARTQTRNGQARDIELRKGIEGWCIACRLSITKGHVDNKGNWIGCRAEGVPADTPFLLIPDRRFFVDRRVTPKPPNGEITHTNGERRTTAPRTAKSPGVMGKPKGKPRGRQGPQVVYVARLLATSPEVEQLPEADRKVYDLIASRGKDGATRTHLLEATDTTKATGKTDGAIRRMRLKKLIEVQPHPQAANGNGNGHTPVEAAPAEPKAGGKWTPERRAAMAKKMKRIWKERQKG